MYAIIQDGSKQYRVAKGDTIEFDLKKSVKEGAAIEFASVLVYHDGEKVQVGTPTLKGLKVVGEVVKPLVKGEKLRVYKYRRREGYHRTVGHREKYTSVKITDIVQS